MIFFQSFQESAIAVESVPIENEHQYVVSKSDEYCNKEYKIISIWKTNYYRFWLTYKQQNLHSLKLKGKD